MGTELDQLAEDIRANGLRQPVTTWRDSEGEIWLLDGRNRLTACEMVGAEPTYDRYEGDDPVGFVVSANLVRRHLTPGQRDFVALEIKPMLAEQAKKRQGQRTDLRPNIVATVPQCKSREQAAKLVGASGRGVQQAQRLAEQAPDLAEKVKAGELAIGIADQQLKRRKAQEEEAQARTIKLAPLTADATGSSWRMLCGDFRERLAEIPAGTVDAIITDPPYADEFLPLWSALGQWAATVLKPQGLLIALSGQIRLPEVLDRLTEHLTYGWTYCHLLPGSNNRVMGRHLAQEWKPWLVFSHGTWPSGNIDWHGDVVTGKRNKAASRWQQNSESVAYLLEHLTCPGDIVLDPMVGVGTYGAVAVEMGREFIGVEADSDRFAQAVRLLQGQDALAA